MSITELYNIMFDPEDCDVVLNIEADDGEELLVPAHRLVLKRRSIVFKTMLEGSKFQDGKSGTVKIKFPVGGISIVADFLNYMYTENMDILSLEKYMILLIIAHFFQMPNLVRLCESRILVILNDHNIYEVYNRLEKYASKSFLNECKRRLLRWAFLIFKNNQIDLSAETLTLLLESDELNVLNEEQVLSALWKWGQWQCILSRSDVNSHNVKQFIGKMLQYIRWSLIKDPNPESPYYFLVEENKTGTETGQVERKSSGYPSILKDAERFDVLLLEISIEARNIKPLVSEEKLLQFILNRDILLLGLKFSIVIQSNQCKWGQAISLLINNLDLQDLTVSDEKQTDKEFNASVHYWKNEVVLELKTPMVLKKNTRHVMSIQKQPTHVHVVSYPRYSFKQSSGAPTTELAINDVGDLFTIMGDIAAVSKLYYL